MQARTKQNGRGKGEYSLRAGEERMTGLRWGRWAETRMTQSINQVDGQDGGTLLRAALEPGAGRHGRVWEYDGRACKTKNGRGPPAMGRRYGLVLGDMGRKRSGGCGLASG